MRDLLPVFSNLYKPAVIAHRGASNYAPENTMSAFELAIIQKADAIELDVCSSKDGNVIVLHGPDIDRTTNGQGRISELTLKQLKKFDAGSHFDQSYQHERIPTLSEVFDNFGQKIAINIEIKNYSPLDKSLPEKVSRLIDEYQLQNFVFISSFHILSLIKIKHMQPLVPIALLTEKGKIGKIYHHFLTRFYKLDAVHPHYRNLSVNLIRNAKKRGIRIHPYTIDLQEDIRQAFQLGIDGIITDDPYLATHIRSEIFPELQN